MPRLLAKPKPTIAKLYGRHQDRYLELIQEFPLRRIRCDDELADAIRLIDSLIDKEKLSKAEDDYLDVLSDLVHEFEEVHIPMRKTPAHEMLAELMELREYTQSQVAKGAGIAVSTVSELLSGKRQMNLKQIAKLAAFFKVGPAVFLPAAGG